MVLSNEGVEFLIKEEGIRLKAYLDSVGVPTIGVGSTYYKDGTKVKLGDVITEKEAYELFSEIVKRYEKAVNEAINVKINQNQFDALVSICYNIGISAFKSSTLVKRINNKASEEDIRSAFRMWKYAGGKPILLNRRIRESDLYFSI